MSTNCDNCDESGIELGARALSGNGFSQTDLPSQLRENVAFRVQSLTSVLMGATSTDGMGPMERRKQLQENRRNLMGQMPGPIGGMTGGSSGGSRSTSTTTDTSPQGSGQISRTGTSPNRGSMDNVSDSTPSMSEVNRGTKERASDQGLGY